MVEIARLILLLEMRSINVVCVWVSGAVIASDLANAGHLTFL